MSPGSSALRADRRFCIRCGAIENPAGPVHSWAHRATLEDLTHVIAWQVEHERGDGLNSESPVVTQVLLAWLRSRTLQVGDVFTYRGWRHEVCDKEAGV